MKISQAQLDSMGEERFLNRMVDILAEDDPSAPKTLNTPEGRSVLRQQYEKAQAYGLVTELDAARYIITAWTLGIDFDTRFPAMREILTAPNLTPSQKADAIEQVTKALMETLRQGAAH